VLKAEAIGFLSSSSSAIDVPDTGRMEKEMERRVVRKLDRNILPVLTVFFFLNFLVRISLFHFEKSSTDFSGPDQYW